MRMPLMTQRSEAPPEQPPASIRVYQDQTRELLTVPYAEWPRYRDLGFRMVPANTQAADLPQPAPASSGLHLTAAPAAGSQHGQFAWWHREASDALSAAATALAPLADSEPIDREKFRSEQKIALADTYDTAIVARACLALVARVEALEGELVALKAAGKGE